MRVRVTWEDGRGLGWQYKLLHKLFEQARCAGHTVWCVPIHYPDSIQWLCMDEVTAYSEELMRVHPNVLVLHSKKQIIEYD